MKLLDFQRHDARQNPPVPLRDGRGLLDQLLQVHVFQVDIVPNLVSLLRMQLGILDNYLRNKEVVSSAKFLEFVE